MTASSTAPARTTGSTSTRALTLAAGVAVAVALNLVIAAVAVSLGAPSDYGPLSAPALVVFTVAPIVVGWFVWQAIARRVRHPRRTLATLVVAVFVLSLIPDIVLLATGFVPGTNLVAVVALMLTHVVVLGVAVVAYVAASRR
jgi:hypothetical protein